MAEAVKVKKPRNKNKEKKSKKSEICSSNIQIEKGLLESIPQNKEDNLNYNKERNNESKTDNDNKCNSIVTNRDIEINIIEDLEKTNLDKCIEFRDCNVQKLMRTTAENSLIIESNGNTMPQHIVVSVENNVALHSISADAIEQSSSLELNQEILVSDNLQNFSIHDSQDQVVCSYTDETDELVQENFNTTENQNNVVDNVDDVSEKDKLEKTKENENISSVVCTLDLSECVTEGKMLECVNNKTDIFPVQENSKAVESVIASTSLVDDSNASSVHNTSLFQKANVGYVASKLNETAYSSKLLEVECTETNNQNKLPKVIHKKIYSCLPKVRDDGLKPFTDAQLRSLYHNMELDSNEEFVDHFIQNQQQKYMENHELYRLLNHYLKARTQQLKVKLEVEENIQDYLKNLNVWMMVEQNISAKGVCNDGASVVGHHCFRKAQFNDTQHAHITKVLKLIRDQANEVLSLYSYSSQVAHLQVELFLYNLIENSSFLRNIPHNAPIQAFLPHEESARSQQDVAALRQCISILFHFQRQSINDDQFTNDTRQWLHQVVPLLLRIASISDHLFLINHILRCPAGVGKWAAPFLQVLQPDVYVNESATFGSVLLDHFVTMLATLLTPPKSRDEFLRSFKPSPLQSSTEGSSSDNLWVLLDSEGEEDEEVPNNVLHLYESDLFALFNQFPMDSVFKHMLGIFKDDEGNDVYDISLTNENSLLRLLAFATMLVRLLREGLRTYHSVRYKQFNKRLGQFVRHIVHSVSDHWHNFKRYYHYIPAPVMVRLQLEFDQFFIRAINTIFCSSRSGAWQFMSDLPFNSLSINMMWKLLWMLHNNYDESCENVDDQRIPYKDKMQDSMIKDLFSEKLQQMQISEAFYLLTVFANMACSRDHSEDQFVETIAVEIYQISFVNSVTRESCSKVGRQLLASIAAKHPFIITVLVHCVQETISQVGLADKNQVALYLFRELPLELWKPTMDDLRVMHGWLMDNVLNTPVSQLARMILSGMNWSVNEQGDDLFLDISLHRKVAIMLVEAHLKFIPDRHQGYITESIRQVSQLASAVRVMQSTEQQFLSWVWELIPRLHLHVTSLPSVLSSSTRVLDLPNLWGDVAMHPVLRAVQERQPLGCFAGIAMSQTGHELTEFCSDGVSWLSTLVANGYYIPSIHILNLVVPLYYNARHYLFQSEKFLSVIHNLLSADQTYVRMAKSLITNDFPGRILKTFTCMIQSHIANGFTRSQEEGMNVVETWLGILMGINNWFRDNNAVYVVNSIIEAAVPVSGSLEFITSIFNKVYKLLQESPTVPGMISSFISWVAAGNHSFPSLMEKPSSVEFPWFAYTVLNVETQLEEESQLWKQVQRELADKPQLNPDSAVKKAAVFLKLPCPPIHRLTIYRWAQQALDTPINHPAAPLILQKFFTLYLQRVSPEPGHPEKGSVGDRFFASMSYLSLLEKLKRRLNEASDFHHKLVMTIQAKQAQEATYSENINDNETGSTSSSSIEYKHCPDFHEKLMRLYRTYVLWLDEPRLHEHNLYLPALPPNYEAAKLLKLFENDKEPWMEFVDIERIIFEVQHMADEWRAHAKPKDPNDLQKNTPTENSKFAEDIPANGIFSILKKYDQPQPPPNIPPLKFPVPGIAENSLANFKNLLSCLGPDLTCLQKHAHNFSERVSKHLALDCQFLDMLPELYDNMQSEIKVHVMCQSIYNRSHVCSGAAEIIISGQEGKINHVIQKKLDENREVFDCIISEAVSSPPEEVCVAVVHLESAITALINKFKLTRIQELHKVVREYLEVGTSLYYYIISINNHEVRLYPPTMQFFASCIDILGQEFILGNSNQCERLLGIMLTRPSLAGQLSPHFKPISSPTSFAQMYEKVTRLTDEKDIDLAFMILTKFDLHQWLTECKPTLSLRSYFMEIIGHALCSIGKETPNRFMMVMEIYRTHLRCLLIHNFPEQLGDLLRLLLRGSESRSLSVEVWYDFLRAIGCPDLNATGEMCYDTMLTEIQIREIVEWFGSHFMKVRLTSSDCTVFGLYSLWTTYIEPLSLWLKMLGMNLIVKASADVRSFEAERVIENLWLALCKMFAPWIQPQVQPTKPELLLPWIPGDKPAAKLMVAVFRDCIVKLQEVFMHLLPPFSNDSYNLFWQYFSAELAKSEAKEHFLVVFEEEFLEVNWTCFFPQMKTLEAMFKIPEKCYPKCTLILSAAVGKIPWAEIIHYHIVHSSQDTVGKIHMYLLSFLVKLSLASNGQMNSGFLIAPLMLSDKFAWQYLDAASYDSVIQWFLDKSDPTSVLSEGGTQEAALFGLLQLAAGFCSEALEFHPQTIQKRSLYIKAIMQSLCNCLTRDLHSKSGQTAVVICELLRDIESVVNATSEPFSRHTELVILLIEALRVLNTTSDSKLLDIMMKTLLQWISESSHSSLIIPLIASSCKVLLSANSMVSIVEACIISYFKKSEPAVTGWDEILAVLEVPQLTKQDFINECFSQKAFLILYAHMLQWHPMCNSWDDELEMLTSIVDWSCQTKPNVTSEARIFPWWHKIIHMTSGQLQFCESPLNKKATINLLQKFIATLLVLGEDKISTGLLGAIGLGKRSTLSIKFRLISRALAAFLHAQMPIGGPVRLIPAADGSLTGGHNSNSSAPAKGIVPSQQAVNLWREIESLRHNKQYSALQDQVNDTCSFLTDPKKCLVDALVLLGQLATKLYPEEKYLRFLLTSPLATPL